MHRSPGLYSASLFVALIGCATPAHALSIIDTFGGSLTGNANAAQIEATIQKRRMIFVSDHAFSSK